MKKIETLFYAMLVMFAVASVTSCNNFIQGGGDQEEAFDLHGTWEGYVDTNSGRYALKWIFRQDGYTRYGTGMEYSESRWGLGTYCEFDWAVRNGNIYIDYYDSKRTSVVLRDYILDYRPRIPYLEGYLQDAYYGTDLAFVSVDKISDYTRSSAAETDTIKNTPKE